MPLDDLTRALLQRAGKLLDGGSLLVTELTTGYQRSSGRRIYRELPETYREMQELGVVDEFARALGKEGAIANLDPPLEERVIMVAALNIDYQVSAPLRRPVATRDRVLYSPLVPVDELINTLARELFDRVGISYPPLARATNFEYEKRVNPTTGLVEPVGVAPMTLRDLSIFDYRNMYSEEVREMLFVSTEKAPEPPSKALVVAGEPTQPSFTDYLPSVAEVSKEAAGYTAYGLMMWNAALIIRAPAQHGGKLALMAVSVGMNSNTMRTYVSDIVLLGGQATGLGPTIFMDAEDTSTAMVVYNPGPTVTAARTLLHRTRQVVSIAQKGMVATLQPNILERFKAVLGIGVELTNLFYGDIPQYQVPETGNVLTKAEFGYLVWYDVMGLYDAKKDISDLYQNKDFIVAMANKLKLIPVKKEEIPSQPVPQGTSLDMVERQARLDEEYSQQEADDARVDRLEEEMRREMRQGAARRDVDEDEAMKRQELLRRVHQELAFQLERGQAEVDAEEQMALVERKVAEAPGFRGIRPAFDPGLNLEWDLANIYAEPFLAIEAPEAFTSVLMLPAPAPGAPTPTPTSEEVPEEEPPPSPPEEEKEKPQPIPVTKLPLVNTFWREPKNVSTVRSERMSSLREFLPHAGTDMLAEQQSAEADAMKIDNLTMGQYKPQFWPLGTVADNPLIRQNIAHEGLLQMPALNKTPTYYEGGSLTMGDRISGTVRANLLPHLPTGPPLKIRRTNG